MRYFTVGPVQMSPRVIAAGGQQAPYFRDQDFADQVIVAQDRLLEMVGAPSGGKIAIMSGSGSAAMEASALNFSKPGDPVIVINGGSFGSRFVAINQRLGRNTLDFKVEFGRDIDLGALQTAVTAHKPICVFLNIHETSSGQLYDVKAVAGICKAAGALLICDAVSTLASDPVDMSGMGLDVVLFSANKGLALAPGAAFLIANPKALDRLACTESLYLDLAPYFDGATRGQPPVTSSIGVLTQLFERLDEIDESGGIDQAIARAKANAAFFRAEMKTLGIEMFPQTPSNAITAFILKTGSSNALYDFLRTKHQLLINKSAWGLEADVPRIAHVGHLSLDDHADLVAAIKDYFECT